MRALLHNAVLCLSILAVCACSSGSESHVLSSGTVSVPKQHYVLADRDSAPVEKVQNKLPVELAVLESSTLGGEMFDPMSLAGKEVLLWFWAPW
ncbi:MAG: hypothetical protein NZ605_03905 [Acidimicrobiales bacterium]|nr:hypothetical protein [Acidimicrobiales bacterium]